MWCAPLPTPGPAPDTAPARHAQSFGNSGHRQVADDDPDQTPPQAGAGDLGPRRRRSGGVLTPHVRALLAAVAAHGEHQRGRAPPERLVRQLPARYSHPSGIGRPDIVTSVSRASQVLSNGS